MVTRWAPPVWSRAEMARKSQTDRSRDGTGSLLSEEAGRYG